MLSQNPGAFIDDDIRVRAYLIWEREGRSNGHSEEYWFRAKAELEAECHKTTDEGMSKCVPPHPGVSSPPIRSLSRTIPKG